MPGPADLTAPYSNVTSWVGVPPGPGFPDSSEANIDDAFNTLLRDFTSMIDAMRREHTQWKNLKLSAERSRSPGLMIQRDEKLLNLTVMMDIARHFENWRLLMVPQSDRQALTTSVVQGPWLAGLQAELDAAKARLRAIRERRVSAHSPYVAPVVPGASQSLSNGAKLNPGAGVPVLRR